MLFARTCDSTRQLAMHIRVLGALLIILCRATSFSVTAASRPSGGGYYYCLYGHHLNGKELSSNISSTSALGAVLCANSCSSSKRCTGFRFDLPSRLCVLMQVDELRPLNPARGLEVVNCVKDREVWFTHGSSTSDMLLRPASSAMRSREMPMIGPTWCLDNYKVSGDRLKEHRNMLLRDCARECQTFGQQCGAFLEVPGPVIGCRLLKAPVHDSVGSATAEARYTICFRNLSDYLAAGRIAAPALSSLGPAPSSDKELVYVNVMLDQDSALASCHALGGSLAPVLSRGDLDHIQDRVTALRLPQEEPLGVWVGLKRLNETAWKWTEDQLGALVVNSSRAPPFKMILNEAHDCVQLTLTFSSREKPGLQSQHCNIRQTFVCIRPLNKGPPPALPSFPSSAIPSSPIASKSDNVSESDVAAAVSPRPPASPSSPYNADFTKNFPLIMAVVAPFAFVLVVGLGSLIIWRYHKAHPHDDGEVKLVQEDEDGPGRCHSRQNSDQNLTVAYIMEPKAAEKVTAGGHADPVSACRTQVLETIEEVDDYETDSPYVPPSFSLMFSDCHVQDPPAPPKSKDPCPQYICVPLMAAGTTAAAYLPSLKMCQAIAEDILGRGGQLLANHRRCQQLIADVQAASSIMKVLEDCILRDPSCSSLTFNRVLPVLHHTLLQCQSCLVRWSRGPHANLANVLHNMARGGPHHEEFVSLCELLSSAYDDLALALNIGARMVCDEDRDQEKEHSRVHDGASSMRIHQRMARLERHDLASLASSIRNEPEAWDSLDHVDQTALYRYYEACGLDLDQMTAQARWCVDSEGASPAKVIPWEQLDIFCTTNQPGPGTVWYGHWKGNGVAVRKLPRTSMTAETLEQLRHLGDVMSTVEHPNIEKFHGLVLSPPHCALVHQYYPRGTLCQLLSKEDHPLTGFNKLDVCLQVAQGMRYLHEEHQVVHGYLTTHNILLGEDGQVVVGGLMVPWPSLPVHSNYHEEEMEPPWVHRPPELLLHTARAPSKESDVYAFGMLMYETWVGQVPFQGQHPADLQSAVLEGICPELPSDMPLSVRELLRSCWTGQADARPAFSKIVTSLEACAESFASLSG